MLKNLALQNVWKLSIEKRAAYFECNACWIAQLTVIPVILLSNLLLVLFTSAYLGSHLILFHEVATFFCIQIHLHKIASLKCDTLRMWKLNYCVFCVSFWTALAVQLGEQLLQSVPTSGVDVVELEDEGTCVRFSPLLTAAGNINTWQDDLFLHIVFTYYYFLRAWSGPDHLSSPPLLQCWERSRKMLRSWWRSSLISCLWWAPQCASDRISERRSTDTAPHSCTWRTSAGLASVLSGKAVIITHNKLKSAVSCCAASCIDLHKT